MPDTIAEIVQAHRSGGSPEETIARTYARIRTHNDPAIFITLRDEAEALADARALKDKTLPLYGVPFAVKDNIDVAGLPTTAACPAFAYTAKSDATCVKRLRAAGAIPIGKTNLDQFATGLVGVRSPYGIPRNVFDPKLIPGGSSSGSGVAVAAGLVPFSLGSDTAGSGRVPAALGNIVGLKPSLGMVSTAGVVPACRTLDCVSVFALTVDDAWTAFAAMAGPDIADPYTRTRPVGHPGPVPSLRIGVPIKGERVFFGDQVSAAQFEAAISRFAALGTSIVEIDIEPFYETARLLYEGPWVAERYLAARKLIASSPDAMHPVTYEIIIGGTRGTAAEAFAAFYKLEDLRRVRDHVFRQIDVLLVPTMPTVYTVEQVLADPIQLNSRLGTYTNFVNLLDLAGLAVPASMRPDGIPFGVTLLAPGGHDALLASLGRVFHADTTLPMGATGRGQPPLASLAAAPQAGEIALAVVGAHLSGMPLNGELKSHGGRFLESTHTAPDYRLFALATQPPKPGLLRVAAGQGASIAVEIWALPADGFGRFVAAIPPPLGIGTLTLSGGRDVKGFLAESGGVSGARDISNFGGWRAFVAQA
ncbi:MAG: allophanate hydrolase [Hyphomicrobiales bacterium]|jgi:allophanate hydrolase|nr:allophanate hydrolase [Hyphomicrobiales bacterium]